MEIFTLLFWKRVLVNAVHAFAGGMSGVIIANHVGLLSDVPWTLSVDTGLFGALISVLASLASQQIPNTAPGDFLPPRK